MIFSKEQLKNFDLYPFITLAVDSNGIIVYKNHITKLATPNIHVGARLSAYTSMSIDECCITETKFYDMYSTVFINSLSDGESDYKIIVVLSVTLSRFLSIDNNFERYATIINDILNYEKSESSRKKYAIIRKINENPEAAMICNSFSGFHLDNINFRGKRAIDVADFFSLIENIIENRLGLDFDLIVDTPENYIRSAIKINNETVMSLVGFVAFALNFSDDKSAKVSFSSDTNIVDIIIEYKSSINFEEIYTRKNEAVYVIALLLGMDISDYYEIEYEFGNKNGFGYFVISLPEEIDDTITFRSENPLRDFICEYFDKLQSIKDAVEKSRKCCEK